MPRTPTLFNTGQAENGKSDSRNEAARGYQYTRQLGKIPKSWEVRHIQDLAEELTAGTSVGGEKRPREEGEIGVLRVSSVTSGRFKPERCKVVDPEDYDRLRTKPKPGTVLLNRASGTLDLVGVSVHVDEEYPNLYLPDKLWRIIPDSNEVESSHWLAALFNTGVVRAKVREYASGKSTGMKNVTQKDFLSIPVPVPPLEEQRRIAGILDTWNRAIEEVDALIGKKRKRLHGLRQRLITGEERFPEFNESWTETTLGEYFQYFSNGNSEGEDLPALSCSKVHGIIPQSEKFDRRVASKDTSNYKVVERGNLVYDPMLLWDASIGFVDCVDQGVVSPAYYTFRFNEQHGDRDFFHHLLATHRVKYQYMAISQGTNTRRRKAPKDAFLGIEVKVPSLREQEKIAEVMRSAETEIQKLKEKREALKRQKKALMQRLLTGAVRTV